MDEKRKEYSSLAFDIVEHAAHNIGSRLPGSENERKFHKYMGDRLREIGIEPKTEEFSVSPRASIGGIPYAGAIGVVLSCLCYFAWSIQSLWFGISIACIITWIWLICSVFLYKTWFDMFFKQKISQNTYGELLPPDGKYDYTIMLSGHTDTSWTWRHSEHSFKFREKPILGILSTYIKVGFGALCFLALTVISTFISVLQLGYYLGNMRAYEILSSPGYKSFMISMLFIPAVLAVGCMFVYMWNDHHEENASRGAMDNATGCALSYAVIKYFHDNPEKMPKNCRIIDFNCGSEEAGLRGSIAFTRHHKGEDILKNVWNLNIDSIADEDYFEVVIKDNWQFTRFDKDLEEMYKETFKELGIVSKTNGCIHNPVGGCDSTPFTKAGVKSVTFAAQNPTLTYYYHTWRDMPDRFSKETVGKGFDVLLGVIDKIDKFQQENGFNGPRTK